MICVAVVLNASRKSKRSLPSGLTHKIWNKSTHLSGRKWTNVTSRTWLPNVRQCFVSSVVTLLETQSLSYAGSNLAETLRNLPIAVKTVFWLNNCDVL